MQQPQDDTTVPVAVSYEFSWREYVTTSFAVSRLSGPARVTAAVGAAMVGLDVLFTLLGGSGGGLIIIGVLILTWVGLCGIGIPLWRWRSDPLIRGPQTYIATDAGLRFHTTMADSTVAWSLYRRAVEYPAFYILFAGRRGGTPILKRAFAGPADEARFRCIVAAHLPVKQAGR
jgi:hypothetical protein